MPKVESACRWLRRELVVTDITTSTELFDQYHLRIPVLLAEDGRILAEGPLTRRSALAAVWRS